jgi:TRAP-type mannitol/chloroaromatic compound transport system substrate-binding protein
VIAQQVANDEQFARIYASYLAFYNDAKEYHRMSEQEYYKNR